MPAAWIPEDISRSVGLLDTWLDSMRGRDGYTGPVSHWWDTSFVYAGSMLDWRYEGIICGYLNLYGIANEPAWLVKAQRAADDLVQGQLTGGHFRNSSFEHGPESGGTPHEAAADIALFEIASVLRQNNNPAWQTYSSSAESNLQLLIAGLWNGQGFTDQPSNNVLVANKNATIIEALILCQLLSGTDLSAYITGAAQAVLSAQVKDGPRAGATVHRGTAGYHLTFGIYTARCIAALARLMKIDPHPKYHDFIADAVAYLTGLVRTEGSWLGHYADGRRISAPIWIAPSGDLLRALLKAREWVDVPENAIETLVGALIRAQTSSGGIPTAIGLASRGALHAHCGLPDFRDILPVTGWCDKAFRALTMLAPAVQPAAATAFEAPCLWRDRPCVYQEDSKSMTLYSKNGQMLYDWAKGTPYPSTLDLWI